MKRCILTLLLLACLLPSLAGQTKRETYPKMYEERPVVLLLMPPINNTAKVEAKEYLYSALARPFIESGYYVISPFLAMDVLQKESAYDSELFIDRSLGKFKEYFGADALVFVTINEWNKVAIAMSITADLTYTIKSTRTNDVLYERSCRLTIDMSPRNSSGGSILGNLLSLTASIIETATTDEVEAARLATYRVLSDLPLGKYASDYDQDGNERADGEKLIGTVRY